MAETEQIGKDTKLSHKKWRALQKRLKRKRKRQTEGAARDELQQLEEEERRKSPSYVIELAEEERKAKYEAEREEFENQRRHALWIEREHRALLEIAAKKEREEKERKRREEEEQKIREEWEEQQKRDKEEEMKRLKHEEERKKQEEEKKRKQKDLLKEATAHEKLTNEETWHNPLAPPSYQDENVERCPFFQRTGACRFGDRCSRAHFRPDSSSTLLIPCMYSHYELEQSMLDEYDTVMFSPVQQDMHSSRPSICRKRNYLSLEYEESELYRSFADFYHDVLPEFKSVGKVTQFKVCCNHEPHLRGNVYVQYSREEDAQRAFVKFNGRWYAGKQLSCEFSAVQKWQPAICGLFHKKKCPKGKNCNFLHVFKNPRNEFWEADRDYDVQRSQRSWSVRSRRSRSRSPVFRRHRSRSRRRRSRSTSRSRSRSRRHRRKRSRSRSLRRSKHVGKKTRRDRSRSRSYSPNDKEIKSRSKSQSPLRNGSKCPSRSTPNSTSPKSAAVTKSPKRIHHTSDKCTQKKPVSFTIRTSDASNQTKVKVESLLMWQNSEPDGGNGLDDGKQSLSSCSSNSGCDGSEYNSKKQKRKKKKGHKKSKKHKSEKHRYETVQMRSEKENDAKM